MKSACLAAAGLLAATICASAGEPLTIGKCVELNAGLAALDHYDRVVGEKVVIGQYKLGEARITVALNMTALKPIVESAERARQGLLAEGLAKLPDNKDGSRPTQLVAGTPEFKEALAGYEASLAQPCPVTPGRIKLSDLKVGDGTDQNAIPPSVLSALEPILDR